MEDSPGFRPSLSPSFSTLRGQSGIVLILSLPSLAAELGVDWFNPARPKYTCLPGPGLCCDGYFLFFSELSTASLYVWTRGKIFGNHSDPRGALLEALRATPGGTPQ